MVASFIDTLSHRKKSVWSRAEQGPEKHFKLRASGACFARDNVLRCWGMPSSVASHSIPPFYACYFLRSLASPANTYIGSTPAPPRRKRQHNGDLTQGAFKTTRSRPWEMECIVYGFSSKIAALQFEWAWTKPHLTRHLKVLAHELDHAKLADAAESSQGVGAPLFPSTSFTPGKTRSGKPKRRRPKPPTSPNSRLLVMRALLRSEPFSGWGLKLAFYTEWSWLAYQRLDNKVKELQARASPEASSDVLSISPPTSRSGQALHPYYPLKVCDFTGVDHKRTSLVVASEHHRRDEGITAEPANKKRTTKSAASTLLIDPNAPAWPEILPKSSNLKALDACDQDFDVFPTTPAPIPSTELTKKAKRVKKGTAPDEQSASEDDDEVSLAAAQSNANEGRHPRLGHPIRFNDEDLSELEWTRFARALVHTSIRQTDASPISSYMEEGVRLYKAAMDTRTHDADNAPAKPCAICNSAVDLTKHLEFAVCPQSHTACWPLMNDTGEIIGDHGTAECSSVFHISCLATAFLDQQQASMQQTASSHIEAILPTHGQCPSCLQLAGESSVAQVGVSFWPDVMRAAYRRSERYERLLLHLVKAGQNLDEQLALLNAQLASPTKKPKRKDVPAAKARSVTASKSPEPTRRKSSTARASSAKAPKAAKASPTSRPKASRAARKSKGSDAEDLESTAPQTVEATIDLT